MKHPKDYQGQEVVVLGLAKSGQAVAELFHSYGAIVTANDKASWEQCREQAEALQQLGIRVICGGHPDDLIHNKVALLVKNPGIPYHVKPIQAALQHGVEIVTEVEAAYQLTEVPIIGITGSNGKTTTTSWVGNILKKAGMHAVVAGNIGTPLTTAVRAEPEADWLVVELSSFQLKGTASFRARIACLLNIYETHLDYHGTLEDYVSSKGKLLLNQTSDDFAIINGDDPHCLALAKQTKAKIFPFSMKEVLPFGVFMEQDAEQDEHWIVYRDRQGKQTRVAERKQLQLLGKHNVQNALAASAICLAAGVSLETIRAGLRSFNGVEHRLEYVADYQGTAVYNDSKATNPAATAATLDAFEVPVVLIAGGLERGMAYDELIPALKKHVKTVVAIGQTRDKLAAAAADAGIKAHTVSSADKREAMEEAVQVAFAQAEPGNVVLLSPACASWDMYTTFEERGSMFKQAVHKLV